MSKFDFYGVTNQHIVVGMNIVSKDRNVDDDGVFYDVKTEVSEYASPHGVAYHKANFKHFLMDSKGEIYTSNIFYNLDVAISTAYKNAEDELNDTKSRVESLEHRLLIIQNINDSKV